MASYDDTATVSGSVVSFSNGADDVPIKSWEVALSASLDGYSSVDVVQTGKNFLDDTLSNLEQGSINGSTGNNENANNRVRTINAIPFPYDKIASSYTWTIPSGCKVAIRPFDKDGNFVQLPSWALAFITQLPTDLIGQGITQMKFVLAKTDNSAITPSDIANIGFQIEVGSTATAYEPYTAPTQYTASLGRTIYGGVPDVVKGEGQETYGKKVFDGTEGTGGTPAWTMISVSQGTMFRITVSDKVTTSATNTLCSYYTPVAQAQRADGTVSGAGTNVDIIDNRFSSVDAFKAWLAENPVTLVYELATPTDFAFEGQEIPTRLGYNAFWSEQGNTELTYYKSGYGFTSVTVHKETPDGEPVVQTVKFHRIVYEGEVDAVRGTGKVSIGESGTEYDPPETFTFPPISMETDEGENTLFANEGDSSITYRKAVD